jgi:starch synthase (maltosyl-transferring)
MMYKPEMEPFPGERSLRFVGDRIRFELRLGHGQPKPDNACAFLRTNLGRTRRVQEEIIQSYTSKLPAAGASWRDVAMRPGPEGWWIELPLVEVGYFQAKAYLIDARGRQYWPQGDNVGISVHPDRYRTQNTIYCAFVRMFGRTRTAAKTANEALNAQLEKLDKQGYAVIPPSGTFRDLRQQLDHIIGTLGCRVLHLLPVNPTPTTYARFGRFGSPYASQDLMAVDPALAEFDRRTTAIDQFRELTYDAHLRGASVFLDIVTNHTGWGSTLQENHPEWFLREHDGKFASPGAWGTVWEDLVELDHRNPASWEHLAEVFLTWCRRGVDGFRCDAGYKVPMAAWRYITSCVRQEYPETIFLLEGLGGSWEATENLLTEGGMQWAYSELFQNYSGREVAGYLGYANRQSRRLGVYVHYSETHDNDRLAKRGRRWSLLRNQLCALTSVSGGYGFTCGVEWLAPERVNVHSSRGLNWDSRENLNAELSRLNRLLAEQPCFYDHAVLTPLSAPDSAVYALRRDSQEGLDRVLVLANTDESAAQVIALPRAEWEKIGSPAVDLLEGAVPTLTFNTDQVSLTLPPGACLCLAASATPVGLSGDAYRRARASTAFAWQALADALPVERLGPCSWTVLGQLVRRDPEGFLGALNHLEAAAAEQDLASALETAMRRHSYPQVITWGRPDASRITLVPPDHWLLVRDDCRFRASLMVEGDACPRHTHSIAVDGDHVAYFPPRSQAANATLLLERYAPSDQNHLHAAVRYLSPLPDLSPIVIGARDRENLGRENAIVLLTNGTGAMARLGADLGRVTSKYDCLLGANLHRDVPVDRHVFAKRIRAWVLADRFITPLDEYNRVCVDPGPPARWRFAANAGDGRIVQVELHADMLEMRNCTVLRFTRLPSSFVTRGQALPEHCEVRLTVRIDLEDRNFHSETKRNSGAEHHFSAHCRALPDEPGFEFAPANTRRVRVFATGGQYHPQPEWSDNIPHPVEQSRGQTRSGDAYSPGWFDLPLRPDQSVDLILTADPEPVSAAEAASFIQTRKNSIETLFAAAGLDGDDPFEKRLIIAAQQFVVRRRPGKTVIAGYPWFLDWGRDTLICARGLLAAGLIREVGDLLVTFAHFEHEGTLPNTIHGEDASNRDTSDAPLWYGKVCEEAASLLGLQMYQTPVKAAGRTIIDVLRSIARGYIAGTPNGIHVDPQSSLVWSPSHFTWMDTNYPAGTPREGYPVEIQVLWISLLRQLERVDPADASLWSTLATQANASFRKLFWLEKEGYLADVLLAPHGQPAQAATPDTALRSNYLLAIALGLLEAAPARRAVAAAARHLVVPGALRSLAPLPVAPPLPIRSADGRLLNNPDRPYFGRYQGDEDTQRKPAYHNGTAWTWTFPTFCEALVRAWECQPAAVAAAKAYLGSVDRLMAEGCLGHLPEVVDGDAPHAQRGCDAQAWGVTETIRVWKWLQSLQ